MTQIKKRISLLAFLQQVRQEAGRVTWPGRKEVVITSILVFVMVMTFAVFFLIADNILAYGVNLILGWGK